MNISVPGTDGQFLRFRTDQPQGEHDEKEGAAAG